MLFDEGMLKILIQETGATLYMTAGATLFAYLLGLPMGIALVVTAAGGLRPQPVCYKILDAVVNLLRSVPFLILLILVMPLTKLIVGKTYGPSATIVPLVIAAAPFIARLVESSLAEVDKGVVEAALSMGADVKTIIWKVLLPEAKTSLLVGATIALGTILGYSAMAGIVGGGGLGDLAIKYGYYRYEEDIMWVTVILLVILVQLLQMAGTRLSKKTDRRIS